MTALTCAISSRRFVWISGDQVVSLCDHGAGSPTCRSRGRTTPPSVVCFRSALPTLGALFTASVNASALSSGRAAANQLCVAIRQSSPSQSRRAQAERARPATVCQAASRVQLAPWWRVRSGGMCGPITYCWKVALFACRPVAVHKHIHAYRGAQQQASLSRSLWGTHAAAGFVIPVILGRS